MGGQHPGNSQQNPQQPYNQILPEGEQQQSLDMLKSQEYWIAKEQQFKEQQEQQNQLDPQPIQKKIQQQPQYQQQQQQQQQQQIEQEHQPIEEEIFQEIVQRPIQQMNLEDRIHIWLSRTFDIITSQQTVDNIKLDFIKNKPLTVDVLSEEILFTTLISSEFSVEWKIKWLSNSLCRLSQANIEQSQVEMMEGFIPKKDYENIVNQVCGYITTSILYSETLEMKNPSESVDNFMDKQNEVANIIYGQLFQLDQFNGNPGALQLFLDYLSQSAQVDDCTKILDMMLKRQLSYCQKVSLEDERPQIEAIQLLDLIGNYPKLIEPLIMDSWGFGKGHLIKMGSQLQQYSIVGRVLSFSTFPNDNQDWKKYFTGSQQAQVALSRLRLKINKTIDFCFGLFQKLLKNQQLRGRILEYFSYIIELNLNLEKNLTYNMHLQLQCCSPGFIHNFIQVLLQIFSPFMQSIDQIQQKSGNIDANLISYLKKHPLLAKIYHNVDQLAPEATPFVEPETFDAKPQPMTILMLLTQRAMHLETLIIQVYIKLLENIQKLHQSGNQGFKEMLLQKFAYDVQLLDKRSIENTLQFLCFGSSVAINLLDYNLQPKYPYGLLGSIFLEDIHAFLSIYNYANEINNFTRHIQVCAEFAVITMCRKNLLQNPHLRVKGIEIFHIFVPQPQQKQRTNNLSEIFRSSEIVKNYLIEGLIKVFVDAERTGGGNQFYDKFKFRYIFCLLINYLLKNQKDLYANELLKVVKSDKPLFLAFANFYLNDMIYFLDECLSKMKEMKIIETEMDNGDMNRQQAHHELQMQLKTVALFLQEYYKNIQIFSESAPEAFLTDEIIDKLVNNMNYTLEQLNGDQAIQYKTKFMKQVNFEPKFIMGNVIELYVNFSHDENFLEQIVKDERCFSLKLFHNTASKLEKYNIISPDRIVDFREMLNKLEKKQIENQELVKLICEQQPDDFVDPILGSLMTDPVKLPHSNVVVDRLTIKKQLLNVQEDPFDRSPLTEDMLIEQPELRQKIADFIEQQKLKIKQRKQQLQE